MKDYKKKSLLTMFAITILLVSLIAATYAYFSAQGGTSTNRDVSITANTTDLLTFQIGNDITFTANQNNFNRNGNNVSGSTTATATLIPNNKTNQATMNYYMYLNLTNNPTVYSVANTNEDAELLLQVFDSSNQLVTLTDLGSQVTIGGLTGYDITGVTGLLTLLYNHTITANGSTEVENWSVVITLVNLGIKQNDNTGKTVTGEVIMRKDSIEQDFCQNHLNDLMCYTMANYDASTMATGTTNLLYYHDENLEDGAEDGSYRYAGSNPNNYVCFGSDATTCPADNLYRIIGFMPVDVVTDDTTTPVTTESKMLYKLIKNDFETETSLGLTKKINSYDQNGFTFPWSGNDDYYTTTNTWGLSTLNTIGLNTNVLNSFEGIWQNKIANVMWKVGGYGSDIVYNENTYNELYVSEISNSGINVNNSDSWTAPADNIIDYSAKIGLMYISDFAYAVPQSYWSGTLDVNSDANRFRKVWLAIFDDGVSNNYPIEEWTITRNPFYSIGAFTNTIVFGCYGGAISSDGYRVRRSFYLTEDTIIDRTLHTGTAADPYRLS